MALGATGGTTIIERDRAGEWQPRTPEEFQAILRQKRGHERRDFHIEGSAPAATQEQVDNIRRILATLRGLSLEEELASDDDFLYLI